MSYFENINAKAKGTEYFYPEAFYPSLGVSEGEMGNLTIDRAGNLVTRSAVFTDEGSFRDTFTGTSLLTQLTGTVTFVNGSKQVVGTNTNFLSSEINSFSGNYIKLDSDSDLYWCAVESVEDDTHLTLRDAYEGTGNTGTASTAKYVAKIGTGGSISVADSDCTIASGVTPGQMVYITKNLDYGPLIISFYISFSQRVANQVGIAGLLTKPQGQSYPENSAYFEFSGTDNTKVVCKSALTLEDEITTVTLPLSNTTASKLRYRIELSQEYVQFSIEGVVVATHYNMVPDPYISLNLFCGWVNTGVVESSSNIIVDTVFVNNSNTLQVQGGYTGLSSRVTPDPTAIKDAQNSREIQLASNREMRITSSERVCGTGFEGNIIDTNLWVSTASNNATNTISNLEFCSASGTTNGALAVLRSKNIARIKSSYQNILGMYLRFSEVTANNKRRVGVFDASRNNGFFFYLNGTEFGVGSTKGGVETLVPSGNFNGNFGSSYVLNTSYHIFEIIYGLTGIDFYIDGKLLQKIKGINTMLVNTMLFYITVENSNSAETLQSSYVYSSMLVVQSLNVFNTQPLSAVIETNGTFTLKIGCGKLLRIINVDNTGTCIVYDNTAGSGTKLLPTLDLARIIGSIDININFDAGLTIVTAAGAKLLVVYE